MGLIEDSGVVASRNQLFVFALKSHLSKLQRLKVKLVNIVEVGAYIIVTLLSLSKLVLERLCR